LNPLEFLKPKTHVICLLQCGGLWFVNGKISITWNLKQAIVQKPKQSMEGTCFLIPKATDVQKMKSLPPPEEVDPDGGVPTTLVADSDDENEEELVVTAPAPTPVKVEEPVTEEVKPKKKIIKKKTDA
jgi:hypothetical protein